MKNIPPYMCVLEKLIKLAKLRRCVSGIHFAKYTSKSESCWTQLSENICHHLIAGQVLEMLTHLLKRRPPRGSRGEGALPAGKNTCQQVFNWSLSSSWGSFVHQYSGWVVGRAYLEKQVHYLLQELFSQVPRLFLWHMKWFHIHSHLDFLSKHYQMN